MQFSGVLHKIYYSIRGLFILQKSATISVTCENESTCEN